MEKEAKVKTTFKGLTIEEQQEKAYELIDIGTKVRVEYGGDDRKGVRRKRGKVVYKTPFHFLVDFGGYKESFRLNQLLGKEETKVRLRL